MDKRVSPVYRNKMEFVGEHLPSSGKLLDVGCGSGLYFHLYKNRNLEFVGLEPDEKLIKEDMICASSEKIPFDDETFDAVFSNGSLHEWSNPKGTLNEVWRVLKQDGRLFVSDLRRDILFLSKWFMWLVTKPKEIRFDLW